jgi:hypothetical protein
MTLLNYMTDCQSFAKNPAIFTLWSMLQRRRQDFPCRESFDSQIVLTGHSVPHVSVSYTSHSENQISVNHEIS